MQIHPNKKRPFNLKPVAADGTAAPLEGPAVVTVEAPAVITDLSEDGLTGFVANPGSEVTSVKFTADGDGILNGEQAFNIHYEATINLVAADAVAFESGVFGEEVDI